MENEQKDVFDRALEFLANKWLERNGFQGYVARSVHIDANKVPLPDAGGEEASA